MADTTDTREQFLTDILVTAVEGGTGYWATVSAYNPDTGTAVLHEMTDEHPDGDPHRLALTLPAVARGVAAILAREVAVHRTVRDIVYRAVRTYDAGDIDADIADCIVQAALLGEVRYG